MKITSTIYRWLFGPRPLHPLVELQRLENLELMRQMTDTLREQLKWLEEQKK